VGPDYAAVLYGGQAPHVGTCVLAVPRPSLTGDGHCSCTSSVINVPCHKDEIVCRHVAETLCRRKQSVVVCTGGIHMDCATPAQIAEIQQGVDTLLEKLSCAEIEPAEKEWRSSK